LSESIGKKSRHQINFLAGVFDKTPANLYFLGKTSPPLVD
jgi:hypothetical protein